MALLHPFPSDPCPPYIGASGPPPCTLLKHSRCLPRLCTCLLLPDARGPQRVADASDRGYHERPARGQQLRPRHGGTVQVRSVTLKACLGGADCPEERIVRSQWQKPGYSLLLLARICKPARPPAHPFSASSSLPPTPCRCSPQNALQFYLRRPPPPGQPSLAQRMAWADAWGGRTEDALARDIIRLKRDHGSKGRVRRAGGGGGENVTGKLPSRSDFLLGCRSACIIGIAIPPLPQSPPLCHMLHIEGPRLHLPLGAQPPQEMGCARWCLHFRGGGGGGGR